MNIKKVKTHELEKCYSIAPLTFQGKKHILVAAEKVNKCLMFDLDGNYEETVWDEPGGTMSMVQVPGTNGQFLATHKFYSPNDSKEAKIVVVTPNEDGTWKVETLVDLPHVHRFDIISRDGVNYIIAATLCSGRDFKDDWSYKGKVYVAKLPEDLSVYNANNQLPMSVIKEELLKNHGYFRGEEKGYHYSVVGTEEGIYKITPPAKGAEDFVIEQLLDSPASDMTLVDLDGDGLDEMVVFSPFHGANVDVYKIIDGKYQKVFSYGESFDFSHAIWSGEIAGKKIALLGNRERTKQLMGLYMEDGQCKTEVYDENIGVANTYSYKNENKEYIVSANRESNEIAFYQVG